MALNFVFLVLADQKLQKDFSWLYFFWQDLSIGLYMKYYFFYQNLDWFWICSVSKIFLIKVEINRLKFLVAISTTQLQTK